MGSHQKRRNQSLQVLNFVLATDFTTLAIVDTHNLEGKVMFADFFVCLEESCDLHKME
jgi:hypothetical protein